jgi:WS/DGAT/MGAT family acyltransferase
LPDRLSALDASFLNLERPHAPMHVAGLYIFEGKAERRGRPGLNGIFHDLEGRLPLIPRYRQRVVSVPFGLAHPVWADDPDFDLSYHLRRAALPSPGGRGELLDFVARIHARPLDRARPLWEMYVIEGLRGGRMALYSKVHHAMIDGISGVDLATLMLDAEPEGKPASIPAPFRPASLPGQRDLVADAAWRTVEGVAGLVAGAIRKPRGVPRLVLGGARSAASVGGLLPLLMPAPQSPLNVQVGPHRRIALVDIELARAKAIKNALGGTVNDVILCAVGEAVHHFLEHRAVDSHGLRYRVMVPVSVRDESKRMALGNQVTAMFMDLPVGPMHPRQRLQAVSAAMAGLKERQQAVAADRLVAITSWAPPTLHALAGRLELTNQRLINLVVSNVPGVQVPLFSGGARLLEAYPLLPLGANLALVICVSSYNGGLYFGLIGDREGLPDLNVLGRGLELGFERLERAARPATRTATPRRRAASTARAKAG